MVRKVNNVEVAEAPALRNKALALLSRVVMPAPMRAKMKNAIEAVRMPLYQCSKLRRSELWKVFKNKVFQACCVVLDGTADSKRIYADIVKTIGE